MTPGAGAYRDDAVDALRRRLLGVAQIDHVVKHDAAVTVHRADHLGRRPQTGDDDRYAVLDAQAHVMFQPVVARVHDLVHRKWRDFGARVRTSAGAELFGDLRQPLIELRGGPGIQRRK